MNILGTQSSYHIGEISEIAAARRAGNDLGRALGFDEVRTGQLALVITEAGTNIVKHATRGAILLRNVRDGPCSGVEVLAIDAGPGMANVAVHMEDGQSSTGTYGVGLGAMQRLAHQFDVYSQPGKGTVLMMVVWKDSIPAPSDWQAGAVCLPLAGEVACGDAFGVAPGSGSLNIAVADGLGHGPDAAIASDAAIALALEHTDQTPGRLMQLLHERLRGTRGAAMALVRIEPVDGRLLFVGVGNIAASVFIGAERRHLLSHNGIVGSNLRKVQEFAERWEPGATVILHSDGLGTRWDLDQYPGLIQHHPALVAAVLFRDFARQRDDAIVLVVRESGA